MTELAEAGRILPSDLSIWGMFLHADSVVKIVMIGLAAASVATWTVCCAKGWELRVLRRRLLATRDQLGAATSLYDAVERLGGADGPARLLLQGAAEEWNRSIAVLDDRDGVKERVVSQLERIESATARQMSHGTGLLATIGATAPFVGLFGTVWGIMDSFIGISKAFTSNLAVVAPGIAEALLATACGLIAAIPAVVIYNHFSRRIAANKALVSDIAAAVLRLVSRDLSLHGGQHIVRAAAPPP